MKSSRWVQATGSLALLACLFFAATTGRSQPSSASADSGAETDMLKVISRAKHRASYRADRKKTRRRDVAERLNKLLHGRPVPKELTQILKGHGWRLAQLRRIRQLAAEQRDRGAFLAAERAVAEEHEHHRRLWQDVALAPQPRANETK